MENQTGLTGKVVYDDSGALDGAGLGETHQHFVFEEGSVVFHKRSGDNFTFVRYVDMLLGP